MDHVRLYPTRLEPARQPEAVAAGFKGNRNPRDLFTGPDRLIAPAMQQAKQPFGIRLQLLLRLTLNAGEHPGNQPARLAQLDDGNDCAILVQGDEGPAQVVQLGHRGTPSVICQRRWCHLLRRLPHTISLLEGDGFEPPVPQQIRSRFRESSHLSYDSLTVSRPGTGSSKPSPSSRQSVSLPPPLLKVENPAFRAGLGSWLGDRVSRDSQGVSISRQPAAISLSGDIPVPQCGWSWRRA